MGCERGTCKICIAPPLRHCEEGRTLGDMAFRYRKTVHSHSVIARRSVFCSDAAISGTWEPFSPPSLRGVPKARRSNLRCPRCIGKRKREIATAHKTSLAMTVPESPHVPPQPSLRGVPKARRSNLRCPRCIGNPKSEIATAQKTSLAMTKPLGNTKERLPRLLAEARNDERGERVEARNERKEKERGPILTKGGFRKSKKEGGLMIAKNMSE